MKGVIENTKEESFSRTDTKIIKGVAIILMLMHHLWAFPDRIAGGALNTVFNIFGESSAVFFGLFGKICVSLFFFLGGYGVYMQSKKSEFTILSNIKKLCLAYWKVFIVFIPIAFLFFRHQPEYCADASMYGRYDTFSMREIIANFFGASSSLNGEWWFFGSYIVAICMFPFWKKIIDKLSPYKSVLLIVAINIIMTYVTPALGANEAFGSPVASYLYKTLFCQLGEFFSCFLMGMLFAKNDWLLTVKREIRKIVNLNFLSSTLAIAAIIFLRQEVTGASLDILWAPLLIIFLLEIIRRIPVLPQVLKSFGTHSTTMWLTHSFCCYYFFPLAVAVTSPRWAVPSLLVFIIMSYAIAVVFDYSWSLIPKLKLKRKKQDQDLFNLLMVLYAQRKK